MSKNPIIIQTISRISTAARGNRLQKAACAFKRGPRGEMAEWLKAHAWKACVRETVPWVRIPLSPPDHTVDYNDIFHLWRPDCPSNVRYLLYLHAMKYSARINRYR